MKNSKNRINSRRTNHCHIVSMGFTKCKGVKTKGPKVIIKANKKTNNNNDNKNPFTSMKQIHHSQHNTNVSRLGIFGIVSRFPHTLLSFLWQPATYQLSIFGALHPSPLSHTREPFTSLT